MNLINMNRIEKWLSKNNDIGLLVLRLFIGFRIIIGSVDNILSWDRMMEFWLFLQDNHFPVPTFWAVLSVYTQFLSAVLILLGYKVRFAAALLATNFIVAILTAHLHHSVEEMTPALSILFISICLLFTGPGKWQIKNIGSRRFADM